MTFDDMEQFKSILEPAIRETVRKVLKDELIPFVERIVHLEKEVEFLKESRRSLFGIWTFIVFVVTFAGKALFDFIAERLNAKP